MLREIHMPSNSLTLQLLQESFAIHSLPVDSSIPKSVLESPIFFVAKTYEEISVVVPEHVKLDSEDVEKQWRALEVVGPLGFSLTGILSRISTILANEKISIFAISTFDTDYILVKENKVESAINALTANEYVIIRA